MSAPDAIAEPLKPIARLTIAARVGRSRATNAAARAMPGDSSAITSDASVGDARSTP